nr:MAG TPA: hypothetical protein [Caudoviricetes sp.]
MDAVEFFKTVNRYCKSKGCKKYLACRGDLCMIWPDDDSVESIEETISKVEQWAKDHPVKTRQSEFLKMFPNAPKSGRVLDICPQNLNIEYMPPKRCENISCGACKTDYWNEEVTDND